MKMNNKYLQQVGVPHCKFCHRCHKIPIISDWSIVCRDENTNSFYFLNSQPTKCSKDCKMYDGTPVIKESEYTYDIIREEFEKLFPKGISKERGAALVLLAYFKMALGNK